MPFNFNFGGWDDSDTSYDSQNPYSPIQSMRMKNIFSNPYTKTQPDLNPEGKRPLSIPLTTPQNVPPKDESGVSDYMAEINRIVSDTPAKTAYRQALQQQPQWEAPGKMGRLGAILTGIAGGLSGGAGAGIAAAQNALYSPYERQMKAYQQHLEGLKDSASIEEQDVRARMGAAEAASRLGVSYRDYALNRDKLAEERRQFEATQGERKAEFGVTSGQEERKIGQKDKEIELEGKKYTTEQQVALANIARMRAATANDAEKIKLDRDELEVKKGTAKVMEKYYGDIGAAAKTRADNPTAGGLTQPAIDRAEDMAWVALANDPKFMKDIEANKDTKDPRPFLIKSGVKDARRKEILNEMVKRQNAFLSRQGTHPGRGGAVTDDSDIDAGPSPYEVGPPGSMANPGGGAGNNPDSYHNSFFGQLFRN